MIDHESTTAQKLRGSPHTRHALYASLLRSRIRSERSNLLRLSPDGTSLHGLSDVPEKQLRNCPTLKGVAEIGWAYFLPYLTITCRSVFPVSRRAVPSCWRMTVVAIQLGADLALWIGWSLGIRT
ncbi:hypothetical protein PAXRUDRAFT_672120 [Paxillus rubicundulus Ve08.2h10]|uniref:Uncharacterized protein n=1 Tax=Paxillus rubicundulus Ve08.2h10 TaxID=930991 RepID=A0A0D0DRU1_9AGAM|nr:hypothetical protein PAXRUDRAFT_672120 [Paxillus rubicundulus Ve08.2h10]